MRKSHKIHLKHSDFATPRYGFAQIPCLYFKIPSQHQTLYGFGFLLQINIATSTSICVRHEKYEYHILNLMMNLVKGLQMLK
ncbi:hypothetical protein CDL12_17579 [Handroanthus impetiginosus]|uniref:Uncharacterized protein n=1 Tax=Handroanthus impetiginosus TaxID=429701 RepID=A0A2G9GX31_9LAMI|nr:hypothetical protein CDL12_17579 [Handroanthus impetiginosus]